MILCGESVKAFEKPNPIIEKALKNKQIKLFACGLSLEQAGVDREALPNHVATVRNGILEAMKLHKEGYIKIDL